MLFIVGSCIIQLKLDLIETAKANAQKPNQYLSWLFERLPRIKPAHKNTYNQGISSVKRLPVNCPPTV